MLHNVKIPSNFTIIQKSEFLIEVKSKYHYWRLTQGNDILILAHKYQSKDEYHKQLTCHNPLKAFKYIENHDKFFESKIE